MPSELFWLPEPRLVADAPLLHGVDDGAERIAELAQRVYDAGRYLGIDRAVDEPVLFQRAQIIGGTLRPMPGVPEGYIARCFVVLGHCRGASPKPRKGGRYLITEKENG